MLKSETAEKHKISEQYTPTNEVIANLRNLCENTLQPIRDFLGFPLIVSSGYRCFGVNRLVGGAANSQHLFGEAADLKNEHLSNESLMRKIIESGVPFDQLIEEFGSWVHISFRKSSNRRQILRAVRQNGRVKYIPFK